MKRDLQDQKKVRTALALGGLLHDTGKVALRKMSKEERQAEYSAVAREISYKDKFKYAHAYNTYLFLKEEYKIDNSIILSSAFHHTPENAENEDSKLYAKIYQLADRLSSSERSKRVGEKEIPLLRSIFQNIKLFNNEKKETNKENGKEEYCYGLKILSLEKDILFPDKKRHNNDDIEKSYKDLWEKFNEEFKTCINFLKNDTLEKALNITYYLFYKYFWCVPASTYDPDRKERHYSDISLFDHARLTSAFSASLYTNYNLNILKNKISNPEEKLKFVFIKGDVSGIQNFLYGIYNIKGVAKRLRGRSFFLGLLPELIARALLEELGYPLTNLIFCGGGHFEVIVGYEENIKETLENFAKEIDKTLFTTFNGKLGFIIAYSIKSISELRGEKGDFSGYREVIKEIHSQLDLKKKQKFKVILKEITNTFDELNRDINGLIKKEKNTKICSSCGTSIIEDREGIEEEEKVCKWCECFKRIGELLLKANYIVFTREELKEDTGFYINKIGGCYFIKEEKDLDRYAKYSIYKINDTEFLKGDKVDGFRFYATVVPKKENTDKKEDKFDIKTFEELAEEADGYKKVAYLRADVDNLGLIFMRGLGDDYSISRIATLSRTLDLFFSGYLNKLLKKYKNKVYVLYSGGDDLFIIGPWNVIFEVIKEIRNEFKEYTCNNDCFDLSCGVFTERGSYPIRFAGDKAGDEEEEAKDKKPAIRALGETLKWDEFERALKDGEKLVDILKKKQIGRTLFYKFHLLLSDYKEKEEKEKKRKITIPEKYRFYPMFYYYLNRNVKDEKIREEIISSLLDISEGYKVKNDAYFKAKYVIMKTRE